MDYLRDFALIPLVVAGVVVVLLINRRRSKELAARLGPQALERGWYYQHIARGGNNIHAFSGEAEGICWQIEVNYQGQNETRRIHWWTESVVLPDDAVLLFPSLGLTSQGFASRRNLPKIVRKLGRGLLQQMYSHVMIEVQHAKPEDAWVLEDIQQVQAGSDALRQYYTIMATNEMAADRFLDEDAEQMLMELVPMGTWGDGQGPPVFGILYWSQGIHLLAWEDRVDIDKLEHIVWLGLALASGQTSLAWV